MYARFEAHVHMRVWRRMYTRIKVYEYAVLRRMYTGTDAHVRAS